MKRKGLILLLILLFPSVLYIVLTTGKHNILYPQYYGPKDVSKTIVDGKERIDTIYHTIPPFTFTNQDGITVTEKDYEGKIYVANFFFATCQSICPQMSSQLQRVQDKLKNYEDVKILSHTVDPDHDTLPVLKEYAARVHADTKKWSFVTGKKEEIYDIAMKGYLLPAGENTEEGGEPFIHSEMFILVDWNRRIRGIYDGTSTVETDKMIDTIKALLAELHARNNP